MTAAAPRAPGLDVLRAAAIVMVMLYHLSAVLALYVALPGKREGGDLQPLWKFVTFTLNLWPDWEEGRAFSHAWSLCVEAQFYLLLPVVLWLPAGRMRIAWTLPVALVAGGTLLRAWLWTQAVAPALAAGDGAAALTAFVERIYNPTWTHLDGLLDGLILAAVRAFRPTWWTWLQRRAGWLLALGAIALAAATRIPAFGFAGAVFLYPLVAFGCACLLAGAASPATPLGRTALPGARTLAILAFGLYLTHRQVYAMLDGRLPAAVVAVPILAAAAYFLASVMVAALLYVAVERPGLRLRERWLAAGRSSAAHSYGSP